jgi:hypothetical protein
MYISSTSISNATVAAQLLESTAVRLSGATYSSTDNSSGRTDAGDTVQLSASAKAVLAGTTALTPSAAYEAAATTRLATETGDQQLTDALMDAEPEGSSTSFTVALGNGASATQTTATGFMADIINTINQTGVAATQPGETAAEAQFASLYAKQLNEGATGRFYNETDVSDITAGLSADQKSSFMTAFENKTLTITPLSSTSGINVVGSGTSTTTISQSGAGGSEVTSSTGNSGIDYSSFDSSKNVLGIYSPFFGMTEITWDK